MLNQPTLLANSLPEKPLCLFCDKDLKASNEPYMAEAAFRQYPDKEIVDTVFSYSICISCYEREKGSLSKDSQKSMQAFFEERVDVTQLQDNLDHNFGLSKCAVSGKDVRSLEAFQIGALCQGDKLAEGFAAMVFSEEVIDELTMILSEHTKEQLQRFREKLPAIPPEFEDLFKDKPLVLL
jgi:hypothetical protein